MSDTNPVRKLSELKPPSKIARPVNILPEKLSGHETAVNAEPKVVSTNESAAYKQKSDNSSILTENTEDFIVGDRVWVGGTKPGALAFIGETQFGPGDWAGVVLDEPIGKNDGSVAGIRYFQCVPNKGIFTRLSRLSRYSMDTPGTSHLSYSCSTPLAPERKNSLSNISVASSFVSRLKTPSVVGSTFGGSSSNDVKVGDRVIVQSSHGSKVGVLRFYGTTEFNHGIWCGVELSDPLGKNDGSVAGVRYFDCAPKHGIFVPAEKVSRSPMPKKYNPGNMSRQDTLESMRSTSTIQTSATSNIKTYKRLTTPGSKPSGSNSAVTSNPKTQIQDELIQNKEAYITQLLREKELERLQITKAATQAEEAEKQLVELKRNYDEALMRYEIRNENLHKTIEKLEKEKNDLNQQLEDSKKRFEDLQFSYEEESITKSEVQALNEEYVEKLKNLEKVVTSQHASLECENQSSSLMSSMAGIALPNDNSPTDPSEFDELGEARQMLAVLNDMNSELENECHELRENVGKLKLIDTGKEKVITSLRNEINEYQELKISGAAVNNSVLDLQNELDSLKTEFERLGKENESLKRNLLDANNKIVDFELSIREKDETLNKLKASLEEGKKNAAAQMDCLNHFQFEMDESKMNLKEITAKLEQVQRQLSAKDNESGASAECITRLCQEIDQRNAIVHRVMVENEENFNIEVDVVQAINSHRLQTDTWIKALDNCTSPVKEKIQLLVDQIENSTDHDIALLRKLETLNEVIAKKDNLVEELSEKNETLRKEIKESIQDRTNELKKLEHKNVELAKIKENLEEQLKKSEHTLKNLEASSSSEDELLRKQLQNIRQKLEKKQDECNVLNEDLSKLKENLAQKVMKSEAERNGLEQERDELKKEVGIANEKLSVLTKQKENLQKDYFELFKVNEFISKVRGKEGDGGKIVKPNEVDQIHRETVERNIKLYKKEFDDIMKSIEKLNKDNSLKDENIHSLEESKKKQTNEYEKLRRENEQLKEELKGTCLALETKKTVADELEKKCCSLREKLASNSGFEEQLQDVQNEYKNLKEASETFESDFKTKLINLENVKNTIEKDRNDLNNRIDNLTKANENLSRQITERDMHLSQLCEEIRSLKEICEQNSILEKELSTARETNETLEFSCESLTNELKVIKEQTYKSEESSRVQLGESEKEIREIKERIQQITDENTELKFNLEKNQILLLEIDKMKNEIAVKNEQSSQLQQKLKLLEETSDKNSLLERNLNAAMETNEILKNSGKSVNDELASVKEKLQKAEESCRVINEETEKRKQEQDDVIERLSVEIKELKGKNLENVVEDLTKKCRTLDEQITKKDGELCRISQELSALKETLNKRAMTSLEELKRVEESNIKLKSTNESLTNKLTLLEEELRKLEDSSAVKLQSTEKEREELNEALQFITNENKELQINAKMNKESFEKTVDDMREKNRNLSETMNLENSEISNKNSALEKKIHSITEANRTLGELNQSLMLKISAMEEQINKSGEATHSKLLESEKERQALEKQIERLSTENQMLKSSKENGQKSNEKQLSDWQNKLQTIQKEMETKERNYKKELIDLEEKNRDLSSKTKEVSTQLEVTKKDLNRLLSKVDANSAKNDLKAEEAVEKIIDANGTKDYMNNNHGSTINEEELKQLLEDKTLAESQVPFLNSVIVDMQRKNGTLLERVQYLENIIPPELLKPKKVIAPRLFCDICDEFDLHETEDCPKQATSSSPLPERRTTKPKPPPRSYCEICEMFGHEQSECKDDETF